MNPALVSVGFHQQDPRSGGHSKVVGQATGAQRDRVVLNPVTGNFYGEGLFADGQGQTVPAVRASGERQAGLSIQVDQRPADRRGVAQDGPGQEGSRQGSQLKADQRINPGDNVHSGE